MKHLLIAFTLLLTACNDGLGEDAETLDRTERSDAMPLASGPYEDMLNREASMVAAVPPPPGIQAPWSGSLNLGNVASFNPDSQNRQTILKLDEWGPPEIWTVSLAIDSYDDSPDVMADVPSWAVTAEIVFGSGGSSQTILVDWDNGSQISLPMNAVSVVAIYNGGLISDPTPPVDLNLGVQLSRGVRGGNFPPTCTIAHAEMTDDGETYNIEIPPFAKAVRIVPQSAALMPAMNGFSFETRRSDGIAYDIQVIRGSEIDPNVAIMIPHGARSILVNQVGAVTQGATNYIFELVG